ncbi:hypothetical protein GCM10009733_035110 [Nonomuraea maheshkhaliensis]|uniref:PNPLA domain-containing protein n=1 Tax=Nonomuraea maheshkhaliensis TaxID=419590 RepID=A0ABN2FA24_9ACTN
MAFTEVVYEFDLVTGVAVVESASVVSFAVVPCRPADIRGRTLVDGNVKPVLARKVLACKIGRCWPVK